MSARSPYGPLDTQDCPCGCRIEFYDNHVIQYVPLSCPFDNPRIGRSTIGGYSYRAMETWR